MKFFGMIILSLSLLISGYLGYLYLHREFSPVQLEHKFLLGEGMEVPHLSEEERTEVQRILSQPFVYLDLGQQMTAYESQDGQYVLKLFHPRVPIQESRFHSLHKMRRVFSMKWISTSFIRKRERLLTLYKRYALAFREMKEEVGLVYVHLSPMAWLDQKVEMKDRDGVCYTIDLGHTPFVLQKKVELALARFTRLQQDNNLEGVKASLEQLRELFASRASKGITDIHQTLHNNYGFLGSKAVQIDVGRIKLDESIALAPDLEVDKIMRGLEEKYPSLAF